MSVSRGYVGVRHWWKLLLLFSNYMNIYKARIEVFKVWYSLFCVCVDAHAEGAHDDAWLIEKMRTLRRELAERIPEVEKEFSKKKQ